jgi:hypothetical protein
VKPRAVVAACALLVVAATHGRAQDTDAGRLDSLIAVGGRVRVTSMAIKGRPEGIVAALDERTLTLVAFEGGLPLKVPLDSITALETSLGRKRNTGKGVAIGIASGLLLGLFLPVDASNCGYYSDNFCSRGEAVTGGLAGGALLGAGIGALVKSDRWGTVRLGRATQTRGEPRAGFAVAIRF